MEYAIHPPEADGGAADHSPWVLESCRDCIESLGLIILICSSRRDAGASRYWPEYQLLFACYLVLLQVRTQPMLEPYLRVIGNVERQLDSVEEMFRENIHKGPLIRESLSLLMTSRGNFDAVSPSQAE